MNFHTLTLKEYGYFSCRSCKLMLNLIRSTVERRKKKSITSISVILSRLKAFLFFFFPQLTLLDSL